LNASGTIEDWVSAEPMTKRSTTIKASYEEMIGQLEDELREYSQSESAS